jgi:hypothetical protein
MSDLEIEGKIRMLTSSPNPEENQYFLHRFSQPEANNYL